MADFGERITRDLTIRYVAVLALLGTLSVAAFLGLSRMLSEAEASTALLNVAGRQRMLVERSALAAIRIATLLPSEAEALSRARGTLLSSLDDLEGAHMGLLAGLPELRGKLKPSKDVNSLYFGPAGSVDSQLREFIAHGRTMLHDPAIPIAHAMTTAAEGPLLDGLEAVMQQYQGEGRKRLLNLSALLGGAVLALLLVILLSATIVFQPMTRRIRLDISNRCRAEKELRESEERLWRILEESPVGVSVSRRTDGRVVFANTRFCEIIGAPREEVIGSSAREHFVDDDQRSEVVQILKDRSRLDDFEVEFRRRDGTPFWSLLTIRPTHFQGETVNLAWVYDITGIKSVQEQLRLTAKVVETASEAVVITNARNEIEFVNPAFTTITEYTAEEAIGKNPKFLQSGRHDADFYRDMWRALEANGRWRGEIWNRRKSGEFYAEWLSIVLIRDEHGSHTHNIAVFSDITHRKEDEERVWRQANYDALTGLPNRSLFVDRLSQAVRQSKRDGKKFALMFIDLDGFKAVNDTLGHAAGDLLLQHTSTRLTECMRASDTVARLAGDEFTIILQGISGHEDAAGVAAKILESLAQPFDLDGRPAMVRGSIGIALFPDDAADGPDLLNMADEAMYSVKKTGKNNFVFANQAEILA